MITVGILALLFVLLAIGTPVGFAMAAAGAAPALAQPAGNRVLRMIPHANLTSVDPVGLTPASLLTRTRYSAPAGKLIPASAQTWLCWIPDPQSRLTVAPGIEYGKPAKSAALRATLRESSPA